MTLMPANTLSLRMLQYTWYGGCDRAVAARTKPRNYLSTKEFMQLMGHHFFSAEVSIYYGKSFVFPGIPYLGVRKHVFFQNETETDRVFLGTSINEMQACGIPGS